MKSCKDCFHCSACMKMLKTSFPTVKESDIEKAGERNNNCECFALASDVVEVVRCKDCKHYRAYEPPIEDFDGWCSVNENEYDKDFYCQYGERREL